MPNFQNLQTEAEKEIYRIVSSVKTQWEQGEVYITDNVYFETRNLIKKCRKNYFGFFGKGQKKEEGLQVDENTGYPKIFVPLTEWTVDNLVKNIDIDTKNIELRAESPAGYGTASILRLVLKEYLRKIRFGEMLNNMLRFLAIDGNQVIKSFEGYNENLEKVGLNTQLVDTLNIIIDPSAESCQKTPALIEKALYTIDEFQEYADKWENVKAVKGRKEKPSNFDAQTVSTLASEIPYIDVYEFWGKLPAWTVDGTNEKDKSNPQNWLDARVVVSGIEDTPIIHLIKKADKRPYEEIKLRSLQNRWLSRSPAESLLGIQYYLNELVNIRLNNMRMLGQGLFKYRRTAGITQAMLSMLRVGGGIPVNNLDDIEQFATQDLNTTSSLNQEARILSWAERVTATPAIARGESLPATRTATAARLEFTQSEDAYSLMKENIGLGLERIIERHWLPIIIDNLKENEILDIIGEPKEIESLDEKLINHLTNEAILKFKNKHGVYPNPMEVEQEKQKAKEQLKHFDKTRFFKFNKDLLKEKINVIVDVSQEELDKNTMIQNLTSLLAQYNPLAGGRLDVDAIIVEVLDLLGLSGRRFYKKEENILLSQQFALSGMPGQPLAAGQPQPQRQAVMTAQGQKLPQ